MLAQTLPEVGSFLFSDESFFYVLFSESLGRFYSGVTTLEVDERLANHIGKAYGEGNFTRKADDWSVFLVIPCGDFSLARRMKLHVKGM